MCFLLLCSSRAPPKETHYITEPWGKFTLSQRMCQTSRKQETTQPYLLTLLNLNLLVEQLIPSSLPVIWYLALPPLCILESEGEMLLSGRFFVEELIPTSPPVIWYLALPPLPALVKCCCSAGSW